MRGPDQKLTRIARRLRANQTDAETVLWNRIRNRQIDGHKFVRQKSIVNYICDFVCREKLVVIEVDGGQHSDSAEDAIRDRRLTAEG
jgi:very-short-patch-repair endonuclease